MADFCKKCSIKMFGEDYGDLFNLLPDKSPPYITSVVICESCGPIQVNHLGECVSPDCKECKKSIR